MADLSETLVNSLNDALVKLNDTIENMSRPFASASDQMERSTKGMTDAEKTAYKLCASFKQLRENSGSLEKEIKNQFSAMQNTEKMLKKLGKTEEDIVRTRKMMASAILGEVKVEKELVKAYIEQERALKKFTQAEEQAVKVAQSLEFQMKGTLGKISAMGEGLGKAVNWKASIAGFLGISLGFKELGSSLASYNRSLFETVKQSEQYGESLTDVQNGILRASQTTTLSKQAFSEINQSFKEMYVGIPPTTSAIADFASKLQKNMGYSAEATTKAMQDLLSVQGRMPDVIDRVTGAIDAYNSGSGDYVQKTMALRGHLRDMGLSAQEVRKQMALVRPVKSTGGAELLDYEKTASERTKAAEDAQLSTAQKLEEQMKLLNQVMTAFLKGWQLIPAPIMRTGAYLVGLGIAIPVLSKIGLGFKEMAAQITATIQATKILSGQLNGLNASKIGASTIPQISSRMNLPMGATFRDKIKTNVRGSMEAAPMVNLIRPSLPGSSSKTASVTPEAFSHLRESSTLLRKSSFSLTKLSSIMPSQASAPASVGMMGKMRGMMGGMGGMMGLGLVLQQLQGGYGIAVGGTQAHDANEKKWKKSGVMEKIGMGFSGEGLGLLFSRIGRSGFGLGETAWGSRMGLGSWTGEREEKTKELQPKSIKERKRLVEGLLKEQQATGGESKAELKDLEDQNKLRSKAREIYKEQKAILETLPKYKEALANKDLVVQMEMEIDSQKKSRDIIKEKLPALKDIVKEQEVLQEKLLEEVATRSQIQDTVDYTLKMIEGSREKFGKATDVAKYILEQSKLGILSPEDIKPLEVLGMGAAANIELAMRESKGKIFDVVSRMKGGEGTWNMLDKFAENKSEGDKKSYSEWKSMVIEKAAMEKKLITDREILKEKESEEYKNAADNKDIEALKNSISRQEKLFDEKSKQINLKTPSLVDMATQGDIDKISKTIEMDIKRLNDLSDKKQRVGLSPEEIKNQQELLTLYADQAPLVAGIGDAVKVNMMAKKTYSEQSNALATREADQNLTLIDLEKKMAAAQARRASAYNLGAYAGYTALIKEVEKGRESIAQTEESIKGLKKLREEKLASAGVKMEDLGMSKEEEVSPIVFKEKIEKRIADLASSTRTKDIESSKKLFEMSILLNENEKQMYDRRIEAIEKETEVAEKSKAVMEGYMQANKEFAANAGVFSKIIGDSKKAVFSFGGEASFWQGAKKRKDEVTESEKNQAAPVFTTGGVLQGKMGSNVTTVEVAKQAKQKFPILPQTTSPNIGAEQEAVLRGSRSSSIDLTKGQPNEVGVRQPISPSKEERSTRFILPEGALPEGTVKKAAMGGGVRSGFIINKQQTSINKDIIDLLNPQYLSGGEPNKDDIYLPDANVLAMSGEAFVQGDIESQIAEMINNGEKVSDKFDEINKRTRPKFNYDQSQANKEAWAKEMQKQKDFLATKEKLEMALTSPERAREIIGEKAWKENKEFLDLKRQGKAIGGYELEPYAHLFEDKKEELAGGLSGKDLADFNQIRGKFEHAKFYPEKAKEILEGEYVGNSFLDAYQRFGHLLPQASSGAFLTETKDQNRNTLSNVAHLTTPSERKQLSRAGVIPSPTLEFSRGAEGHYKGIKGATPEMLGNNGNYVKGIKVAARGGRIGSIKSIDQIQVPQEMAKNYANAMGSGSSLNNIQLKLNPEVQELLQVEGRKNYNTNIYGR